VLLKNGVPFARLVPAGEPVCRGSDLAEALESSDLTVAEAQAWYRDLETVRNEMRTPTDKWQ
jgi:hypothetical protein